MALAMAAVTGLMAQWRIMLPFSDVPLTGQTFAALMAGVALGGAFGSLSQVFYVALGAAGVPWFSGARAGLPVLLGPTAGYMVGFALTAGLIGWLSEHRPAMRRFVPQLLLMATGSALILVCGWVYLVLALGRAPMAAFLTGVVPFVIGDLGVKTFAAAGLGTALLPKDGRGQPRA